MKTTMASPYMHSLRHIVDVVSVYMEVSNGFSRWRGIGGLFGVLRFKCKRAFIMVRGYLNTCTRSLRSETSQ